MEVDLKRFERLQAALDGLHQVFLSLYARLVRIDVILQGLGEVNRYRRVRSYRTTLFSLSREVQRQMATMRVFKGARPT